MKIDNDYRLAVVVAAYNSGDYIGECLESLARQTLQSLQVIIVIDGSDDEKEALIVEEYCHRYNNFTFIKNVINQGTGFTRQVGIDRARSDYIGFLDTDDYVTPECFEKLVKIADFNKSDIVVSNYFNVANNGEIYNSNDIGSDLSFNISGDELFKRQIRRYKAPYYLRVDWWNKIYRRSMFLDHDIKLPHVVRNEGTMSMVMSIIAKRVTILDEKLFYTVAREGSVCRTFRDKNVLDIKKSTIHFLESIQKISNLDNYIDDIVNFFCFVLFNHNLQLILKESPDNRRSHIDILLEAINSDIDTRRLFHHYLANDTRKLERHVYASLLGERKWAQISKIKKTDFFSRKEGGRRLFHRVRSGHTLVSVITIIKDLYSSGRLSVFEEMLQSVASQTIGRENIEHIVVDANSLDGTREYLEKLSSRGVIDFWISERDSGIYNAMNKGANLAVGEYVIYMNSDDYFSENALELLVSAINDNNTDYAYGNAHKVNDYNKKVGKHTANINKVFFGAPYCHQTLLVRRACFDKVNFDETYRITMWAYALSLFTAGYTGTYVDDFLAYFRVGGISTDTKHQINFKAEQNRVKEQEIVSRITLSFDEYEYLNHVMRKWNSSNFSISKSSIYHKVSDMLSNGTAFQKDFSKAVFNLVSFEKSSDNSILNVHSRI